MKSRFHTTYWYSGMSSQHRKLDHEDATQRNKEERGEKRGWREKEDEIFFLYISLIGDWNQDLTITRKRSVEGEVKRRKRKRTFLGRGPLFILIGSNLDEEFPLVRSAWDLKTFRVVLYREAVRDFEKFRSLVFLLGKI